MSEIIKLEDGTEREVPTTEEIEKMQFRSDERKKQREEEKESKKELQEELLKLTNKDHNFSELKKKTKLKESEIKEKEEELAEARKTFVERQTLEYEQDALIDFNVDEKEKEKILHCYNNELTTKAVTKNEIKEKMNKAYKLTISTNMYNPVNQAVNYQGGGSRVNISKSESDVSKEMRSKIFKTNDDDAKKYGPNWSPKV